MCAPGELLQLVRAGLRNPVKVEVKVRLLHAGGGVGQSGDGSAAASGPRKTSATPSSLSLFYMLCEEEQRLPQLLHFLGGRLAAGPEKPNEVVTKTESIFWPVSGVADELCYECVPQRPPPPLIPPVL